MSSTTGESSNSGCPSSASGHACYREGGSTLTYACREVHHHGEEEELHLSSALSLSSACCYRCHGRLKWVFGLTLCLVIAQVEEVELNHGGKMGSSAMAKDGVLRLFSLSMLRDAWIFIVKLLLGYLLIFIMEISLVVAHTQHEAELGQLIRGGLPHEERRSLVVMRSRPLGSAGLCMAMYTYI
ncbi:hypothetical protein Dimus_033579 [Dionaea muscipula]